MRNVIHEKRKVRGSKGNKLTEQRAWLERKKKGEKNANSCLAVPLSLSFSQQHMLENLMQSGVGGCSGRIFSAFKEEKEEEGRGEMRAL